MTILKRYFAKLFNDAMGLKLDKRLFFFLILWRSGTQEESSKGARWQASPFKDFIIKRMYVRYNNWFWWILIRTGSNLTLTYYRSSCFSTGSDHWDFHSKPRTYFISVSPLLRSALCFRFCSNFSPSSKFVWNSEACLQNLFVKAREKNYRVVSSSRLDPCWSAADICSKFFIFIFAFPLPSRARPLCSFILLNRFENIRFFEIFSLAEN